MKLLLHMCCAPCSIYPISALNGKDMMGENAPDEGSKIEGIGIQDIEIQGLFYNPNIHPVEEYMKRKENIEKLSHIIDIPITYMDECMQNIWEKYDGSDYQRCVMCYGLRLEKAAAFALKNGFDAYSTTLLVSPYQKHELIRELGEKYALGYGVKFFYRDFRVGFRQGQQWAKEMGLYRQKFCGCIFSR